MTSRKKITMLKRAFRAALLGVLFGSIVAWAQNDCGNTKLICLIPTALHTTSSTFNFFNAAFGTQVAQLPLATPASGFIFSLDKASGVYTSSQESFGPLLAERSETIGRHMVYLAFTYQRFNFSNIDGNDLKSIPILFSFFDQNGQLSVVTDTQNRVDAKVDQFVAFGTLGLTDRIDLAIAVPFERVSLGLASSGTEFAAHSPAQNSFTEALAGSAQGVGDVLLSAKATVLKHETLGVAVGMELRFASGDEENFLGSGAFGFKPFVVVSRRGRVAPHLNLGYQWNGHSILARDQNRTQRLPDDFTYAAGADIGVTKRLTIVGDLVGQYFFDAPQVSTPQTITAMVNNVQKEFSSVVQVKGSYTVNNAAIGLKANLLKRLLLSANVLIKLDDGGVRAKVVPMVGLSYSF